MNNQSNFSKNVSILFIRDILGYFLNFLLFPMVAKMLGPAGLGQWSQFNLAFLLVSAITCLNLGHAFIRFSSGRDTNECWNNLNSILITSTVTWALFVLITFPFHKIILNAFFKESNEYVIIFILLATLGRTIFGQLVNYYKVINNFFIFSMSMFLMSMLEIILLLIILFLTRNIFFAFMILAFDYLIVGVCIYMFMLKKFGFKKFEKEKIKEYIIFALPVLPASLGFWFVNSSNRFIISSIKNISQTGVFSASFSLAALGLFFMGAISNALGVDVSTKFNNNRKDEAVNTLSKTLKIVLLLLLPFFFGLSVFAKEILLLLTTKDFISVGVILVPILCLGILSYIVYQFHAYLFDLFKKTKIIGIIWLTIGSLSIFLNIFLVNKWGAIGGAVGTSTSFMGVLITSITFSKKYAVLFRDNKTILKSILSSLLMVILISMIPHNDSILGLIMTAIFGFIIYVFIMILFKGISKEEYLYFKNLALQVFSKK